MYYPITYRLQSISNINEFAIDKDILVFQKKQYPLYLDILPIVNILVYKLNKSGSNLRAGLFASLGFTLIGLIYKISLIQCIVWHNTKVIINTSIACISRNALLSEYAFAKAYQATNSSYKKNRFIHTSINKQSKISIL
ncbi:hypothetical protein [Dokdonia pacifica]|uniref:Uncharacterized protein n=1 Tax=Dokdonia pacifica TaxID=1627892 RepID=A0A239DJN7_9FLAO|nr:hypothetical protein [Dokdonia pacifica]SNS32670.1 hypothetical protein SAMN06265376_11155 [Dokdonia pacifica]